MSYKVKIALNVRNEIGLWGLPRNVLIQVLCRLHDDLGTNPEKHLKEQVVAFANMFTLPLAIVEGGQHWSFLFFVRIEKASNEVVVVAARLIDA